MSYHDAKSALLKEAQAEHAHILAQMTELELKRKEVEVVIGTLNGKSNGNGTDTAPKPTTPKRPTAGRTYLTYPNGRRTLLGRILPLIKTHGPMSSRALYRQLSAAGFRCTLHSVEHAVSNAGKKGYTTKVPHTRLWALGPKA